MQCIFYNTPRFISIFTYMTIILKKRTAYVRYLFLTAPAAYIFIKTPE